MKRKFWIGWAVCMLLALPFRVEAGPVEEAALADRSADAESSSEISYELGPQNVLQIKILGDAATNNIYRVDEDGYIRHALVGRVKLGGLTIDEAERLMERSLDRDYIINPKVTIFILEYSHFSILGEVRRPGSYELSGRVSVIKAISLAGGFTPVANQRGVKIIRKNSQTGGETEIPVDTTRITRRNDTSEQVYLQADDVVIVGKSFF